TQRDHTRRAIRGASDVREQAVQGARDRGWIQRVDEELGVADLAPATGTHEAPQLRLVRPRLLRGLLLQGPERAHLALRFDDGFDRVDSEGADELVFEIGDADEEPERFHVVETEVGAESGALEPAAEVGDLAQVAESRHADVGPVRSEPLEATPDVRRATHRHHRDPLTGEITPAARRERFERALVA